MRVYDQIAQQTPEWFALKAGLPAASHYSEIITAARGDLSKSRTPYMDRLLGECFCPDFRYTRETADMRRGNEQEPEARDAFREWTGLEVAEVGFVQRDDGISGCSPDGLIVDEGGNYISGLEVKCPTPKVHVRYHAEAKLPSDYKQQVHGSMVVTGLNTWHFWSYCRGIAPFHFVVKRDGYTAKVENAIKQFEMEYRAYRDAMMPKLSMGIGN